MTIAIEFASQSQICHLNKIHGFTEEHFMKRFQLTLTTLIFSTLPECIRGGKNFLGIILGSIVCRSGIFCLWGLLSMFALSTPALAADVHSDSCAIFPSVFSQLKSMLITVDFPPDYKEAIECQGREDTCARVDEERSGSLLGKGTFQNGVQYRVKEFKELEANFPSELYPENLAARFKSAIEGAMPRRASAGECFIPPPVFLEYSSDLHKGANSGNTLTVTLRVKIEKHAKNNTAILAISYFRADGIGLDYPVSLPWLTEISFDLSSVEIASILDKYFMSGVLHPSARPLIGSGK